jgi:hypothetical protein
MTIDHRLRVITRNGYYIRTLTFECDLRVGEYVSVDNSIFVVRMITRFPLYQGLRTTAIVDVSAVNDWKPTKEWIKE